MHDSIILRGGNSKEKRAAAETKQQKQLQKQGRFLTLNKIIKMHVKIIEACILVYSYTEVEYYL
jgi:hypothetical protein